MNRAQLGAHEQHAVRAERNVILEQLAARRGCRDLRRVIAGLDLGHEQLAVELNEIVRAELGLVWLAVDQRRPPCPCLPSDDLKPGAAQHDCGIIFTIAGSPRAHLGTPRPSPAAQPPLDHERDQRAAERDGENQQTFSSHS